MLRVVFTLFALLGGVAVAQAQAPAIRAGTYDLEVAFGGGVMEGTLVITSVGDSIDARLKVGGHDSPVRPSHREGARLTLEGTAGAKIRYQLDFKGDEVSGSFTYEGDAGSVTGKRRRAAGR